MPLYNFVSLGLTAFVVLFFYLIQKDCNDKRRTLWKQIALIISSIAFSAYVNYRFALLILAFGFVIYFCSKSERLNTIGIVFSICYLAVFKYFNFFVESIAEIFNFDTKVAKIVLPLGISFYVFSAVSYLCDIKHKETESLSLLEVLSFITFFPKITSGPIQKADDFIHQIRENNKINWRTLSFGLQIFVFGLFKKIVLADRLSIFVNQIYDTPMAFGSITVFLAVLSYSLQIYFDFSGYSDMAIGISKMMGIELPINFNLPYLSHNITEFWKRWHITFSMWLQKYLYIPLGGNRKGKIRTYINLLLTMVIGGIWHNAGWNYVIWGALNGIALIIHKLYMEKTKSPFVDHKKISSIISVFFNFIFVSFMWVFFRCDTVSQSIQIIVRVFSFSSGVENIYLWSIVSFIVLGVASFCAYNNSANKPNNNSKKNVSRVNGYYPLLDLSVFHNLVIFFVICGLLLSFAYTNGSPFIYGKY